MEKDVTAILRAAHERGLPSLLIGGNAIILLGYLRNTIDLDLLLPEGERSRWLDLLRDFGYRFFHGVSAFAQFEPPDPDGVPIDLMFVEQETWEKLLAGAREATLADQRVMLPRPEYLVALKLTRRRVPPARSRKSTGKIFARSYVSAGSTLPSLLSANLSCGMVVKMGSHESNNSVAADAPLAADLRLPVFGAAQREHWPSPMSWTDAVRHFANARADYMRRFDSPEKRSRSKNPARFSLAS